jgi:hypothetical protein
LINTYAIAALTIHAGSVPHGSQQPRQLLVQPLPTARIASRYQGLQNSSVGFTALEVPAATQQLGLLHRLLESPMRLLGVAALVGFRVGINPLSLTSGWLHFNLHDTPGNPCTVHEPSPSANCIARRGLSLALSGHLFCPFNAASATQVQRAIADQHLDRRAHAAQSSARDGAYLLPGKALSIRMDERHPDNIRPNLRRGEDRRELGLGMSTIREVLESKRDGRLVR